MKNYLWVFCYCLYNLAYTQDCNHTFSGKIYDFHDGTAIVDATVYIESINKYAVTNAKGEFRIKNICKGTIEAVISHIACEPKKVTIDITGDTTQTMYLEHHIEALNLIEVKASNVNKLTKTAQETLIKSREIEAFNAQSLGDVLKEVSGVSSINTGNTIVKPMINGLHSSRIAIITNGVRLQDQEWGIEHAPNIDLSTAHQINVIKGANALAFGGGAIGGVVVIKPMQTIAKDSIFGKSIVSGQTNSGGLHFNTSLTKTFASGWYANGVASLKRFGDFNTPDYNLSNTGLNTEGFFINGGYKTFEKGFNVSYSYLNSTIGILRASHLGNIEDLVNAINSGIPSVVSDFSYDINAPKQEVTHQIVKANFFKRFKKFGLLEVQYDFQNNQRYEFDIRVGDDRNKPALDLRLNTHTVTTNLKLDAKNDKIYTLGLNMGYQNNFAKPDTGVRRLIPDYDSYNFGVFAISNINLNNRTSLDFGFRYDFTSIDAKKFYQTSRWENRNYNRDFNDLIIEDLGTQLLTNPIFNYHNISASAGITYDFNTQHSVLFNYGLTQRPPNPSELFSDGLHHSAARIELGDLRITKETSNRFSATYTYKTEKTMISVEGFYNRINDFMYLKPTGTEQTIRGAFPVWSFEQTSAQLFGCDVSLHYNLDTHWKFSHNASIIKGMDILENIPLIDMPPFKSINALEYSNAKWCNFNAKLQSEWVLRQNEFPDFNFETFIPTLNETILVDISTPPPAYHLLHFKSDVIFNISEKTKLNVSLSINNLLNTTYRDYLNRFRFFADDLGRNFMLQLKLNY